MSRLYVYQYVYCTMCPPKPIPQRGPSERDLALINSTHTRAAWLTNGRCIQKIYRRHRETREIYCLGCALNTDNLKENFVLVTGHYLYFGPAHGYLKCRICKLIVEIPDSYQQCEYCKQVHRDFARYLEISGDRVYLQDGPVEIFIESLTTP